MVALLRRQERPAQPKPHRMTRIFLLPQWHLLSFGDCLVTIAMLSVRSMMIPTIASALLLTSFSYPVQTRVDSFAYSTTDTFPSSTQGDASNVADIF
jgi:hypothetical protein